MWLVGRFARFGEHNMVTTVKIQISLATGHPVQQCLIYNQDCSVMMEGNLPEDIKKLMGDRVKAFARASIKGHRLIVKSLIKDQGW